MKKQRQDEKRKCAGFTLTEMIVVTVLFGIISLGLTTFTLSSSKGMFWALKKSLISKDVRHFTLRISKETLGANTGYVYPSYLLSDRDEAEDRKQSGEAGDCLVLICYDPYPDMTDEKHYTKIIIYYRQPDADGRSPVYRVEKQFDTPVQIDANGGFNHFEEFLQKHFGSHNKDADVVLELSRGLADGSLFRNFGNNSFIINGEILHGNKVKEITNTYNLTISPRG